MKWALAIVALAVLAVAGLSRRMTNTSITPAMAFVAIGLLAGPLVTGEIDMPPTSSTVRTLAEATLAIVLFSDASRINMRSLRGEYNVPLRLLGIGLPLTIVAGAALAAVMFGELNVPEACLLAIVLAPTDAALGQAVVTEPRLPSSVRQGLNVESGLNDGICVPLLLIAMAAAEADATTAAGVHPFTILAEQLGYGVLGGVIAGAAGAALVLTAGPRDLIVGSWLQLIPVATAVLAYGIAAALGGSGFIAAFLAGGLFGALAHRPAEAASRLSEELSELLGGITFLVFGAILLGPALEHLDWQIVLYAVLSLTVVRMVPVAISMLGSGAQLPTVGFLGWFGPRGLASIVFVVLILEDLHLPGNDPIVLTTYVAIGMSVLAHGISAAPLASRYADWFQSHPRDRRPKMESADVPSHRPRRGIAFGPSPDLDDVSGVAAAHASTMQRSEP